MDCKELVELVTAYLEDTLPQTDRQRFELHLSECQGCRNYFDQMRKTLHLVGRLSEENVSNDAQEKLLKIFRDWHKAPGTHS